MHSLPQLAQNTRIVIDSKSRASYSSSSSNCIFQLSNAISLAGRKYVRLLNFTCYSTVYNITSANNNIDFEENATVKLATVPAGFYTASTLATAVKTALDTASGGFATFTVTYSSTTGKFTIASTQSFELLFATGANSAASLFDVLGWTDASGINPVDTAPATSATAPFIADLSAPSQFYITINEFDTHHHTTEQTYFTFVVPNTSALGSVSTFNYNANYDQTINISNNLSYLRTFSVRIHDVRGRVLDLNNSEWSMMLELV